MTSNNFIEKIKIRELTAKMLLEVNAVHFNSENPFKLTSGLASPVYIDCRKLISFPQVRKNLIGFSVSLLFQDVGFEKFDCVAGGETAGIPFAAWISNELNLPMQYVRKKPKGFGRNAQIEGEIHNDQRVLLVEDLATDGGSKIKFCQVLRNAGLKVEHASVIFYYDIFPSAKESLKSNNINLHYLATWHDVLRICKKTNHFSVKTINEVESFLESPLEWSEKKR